MINRRQFLKFGASASLISGLPASFKVMANNELNPENYYIFVQASGAWDVTCFCDPKENVSGQPEITTWSKTASTQHDAGNIPYAPFADNKSFFTKYYQYMLVINGIDAQTNSHQAGRIHNFSGRLAAGFPTTSAIAASIHAPDIPISYIALGQYSETGRLIRGNRLGNPNDLLDIINPNQHNSSKTHLATSDWARIKAAHVERNNRLMNAANKTSRQKFNREIFSHAVNNRDQLTSLSAAIEDTVASSYANDSFGKFQKQIDITFSCFKAGSSISADLLVGGFDSHTNNDAIQKVKLKALTDGLDHLWTKANSITLNDGSKLSEKLVVVISSDFSRTPYYNANNGKDHWPIGSAIFMKKGAEAEGWGNRVIGKTDDKQNAIKIDPSSLEEDDNGVIIYPKDVIAAARRLFKIDSSHPNVSSFPLDEDLMLVNNIFPKITTA